MTEYNICGDKDMENEKNKAPSIKFPGTSWWNSLLTIAIVGLRAFQPNAEPMSQWSGWSWVWMTLPIWGPAMFGTICAVAFLIMWLWANTTSKY